MRPSFIILPFFAAACCSLGEERRGDNPDAAALSPAEEKALFHLPPGFEIQLVASEPEIQKPINLNFDAAGRLWVTGSVQYPWPAGRDARGEPIADYEKAYNEIVGAFGATGKAPAPTDEARDTVRVLSDFDETGHARKIEIFADGLNIPSGVQPLPRAPGAKGDTAIVYSIPYIWRLEDRDGDGRAEQREILYGPFGYLDTHGGSSSYLQWVDGWIYGTHGFRNHSEVRDRNGKVVTLDSGNTYRFLPDGSKFEAYSHGQTNPFGLAIDPLGNVYSADSHSKPVYLVLPGGYYEGLGKSHDGLGFAPRITDDDHGSSAIAGIAYYGADQFPPEFRGNLFNGNPVTRCVNRDALEWHGSTPKANRQPDFVVGDDPWFRPVQVKLGPDGALYIADFYNPIIGHYEVPLIDPRRDHVHGRIWRVVYRGEGASPKTAPDLRAMGPEDLVKQLAHPNQEVRRMAVNELVERVGSPAEELLAKFLQREGARGVEDGLAIWAKNRLLTAKSGLENKMLAIGSEAASESGPESKSESHRYPLLTWLQMARGQAQAPDGQIVMKMLATAIQPPEGGHARSLAPEEQRCLMELVSRHPGAQYLPTLVGVLAQVTPDDTELRYAARMALRDCLLTEGGFAAASELVNKSETSSAVEFLADASLGAATPQSGEFLLGYLLRTILAPPRSGEYLGHALRHLPPEHLAEAVETVLAGAGTLPLARRLNVAAVLSSAARERPFNLDAEAGHWVENAMLEALASNDGAILVSALAAVKDLATEAKRAPLEQIAGDAGKPFEWRKAALEAGANLSAAPEFLGAALSGSSDLNLRRRAAELLGQLGAESAQSALVRALPTAPSELAFAIASALVQHEAGCLALVEVIEAGHAAPTMLLNTQVAAKIAQSAPILAPRVAALTANLPAEDARLNQVIAQRARDFGGAKIDAAHGAQLFQQTCRVCHRLRNEGGNVGPNLDGVSARGVHRLVEDILDPNRNVDPAFRQTTVETNDGRTVVGANPREENGSLLLQDATGAAQAIPLAQIHARSTSRLSLMPAAFEQAIPVADFNDLLGYLLNPSSAPPIP